MYRCFKSKKRRIFTIPEREKQGDSITYGSYGKRPSSTHYTRLSWSDTEKHSTANKQNISFELVRCTGLLLISSLSMKMHTSDNTDCHIVKPDVGPPSTQKKSERGKGSSSYSHCSTSIHIRENGRDRSYKVKIHFLIKRRFIS